MKSDSFIELPRALSAAKSARLRGVTHPGVDAREASRAKQLNADLGEFTVTVLKPSNEEKQDVRVCAHNATAAQTLAMFYTGISFLGETVKYAVQGE